MAANHTRPRGRPVGIPQASTTAKVRTVNRVIAQAKMLPLDVMMKTMMLLHDEGEAKVKASDIATNADDKHNLKWQGLTIYKQACEVAGQAAPYLHAKLQAVTLKNDEAGVFMVKFVAETNELLKKIQGEEKK